MWYKLLLHADIQVVTHNVIGHSVGRFQMTSCRHETQVLMAGINAAGELAPEAEALSVTTWQGPVEVTRSARIPVSAFAEQLLSEPEQEPDGKPSALSPQPSAHGPRPWCMTATTATLCVMHVLTVTKNQLYCIVMWP